MIRNAVLSSVALLALAACNAPETSRTPEAEPPVSAPAAPTAAADVLAPQGYRPLRIGMTQAEVDAAVEAELDAAVEYALAGPHPDPATALDHLYASGLTARTGGG